MGLTCCFCGHEPKEESDLEYGAESESGEAERASLERKSAAAAHPPEVVTFTQQGNGEEDVQTSRASGRLARHLLERQPSRSARSKLLHSSSFGGTAGQRWVNHPDGAVQDGHMPHASSSPTGLLLQEVKPLHDPVAGPHPSRLGASSTALGNLGVTNATASAGPGSSGFGSMGSSSMTFARSVSRLNAFHSSGPTSRRCSLLDVDFARASLQAALGSSLFRSSASAHGVGAWAEPWLLHSILRPPPVPPSAATHSSALSSATGHASVHVAAAHVAVSAPAVGGSGPFAAATSSVTGMATGRPSMDQDGPRISFGQLNLPAPPTSYALPLFNRSVCERAMGLPTPLVVLVLRPAATGTAGAAGAAADTAQEALERDARARLGASGISRKGTAGSGSNHTVPGTSNSADALGYGDATDRLSTGCRAVATMYLDLPAAPRRAGPSSTPQAPVAVPTSQSGAQQPQPDAESEAKRAYAALAAALRTASGGEVALLHAWHNTAAGALMSTISSYAAAPSGSGAAGDRTSAAEAAAASGTFSPSQSASLPYVASAVSDHTASVSWAVQELFDADPCLAMLARDLLRQAAVRPEHIPPLTHALVPTLYSTLLGGRDAVASASAAVAAAAGRQAATLGAAALQAAVHIGNMRMHVCAYQAPAAGPGSSGSLQAAAWQPAIVLEWPQAHPHAHHLSAAGQPHVLTSPSFTLGGTTLSNPQHLRGTSSNPQLRLAFLDADMSSSAAPGAEAGQLTGGISVMAASGRTGSTGCLAPFPSDAGLQGTPTFAHLHARNGAPPSSFGVAGTATPGHGVAAAAAGDATGPSAAARGGGGDGGDAAAGSGGGGPDLAPLAGDDLLYVIQTWQRHHLLLASVPYTITLFDCGGRVLQQNQGSVDFMGDITAEAVDAHHNGVAPANAGSSEARESVASMAKAEAEAAGKVGGVGSAGGASAGGAMLSVSEVDVLSVLFCNCPDLLDEMLEEVICGNMWRGIVQVPRVMRPVIRAAQRCGTVRSSTAGAGQGRSTAAASDGVAGSGGKVEADAAHGPPRMPAARGSVSPVAATSGATKSPLGATSHAAGDARSAAPPPTRRRASSHLPASSGAFPTTSAFPPHSYAAASTQHGCALDAEEHRPADRAVAGQVPVRQPLAHPQPRQLAAHRRPPSRSYSLRGLMHPTSMSFTLQQSHARMWPHRLAGGDAMVAAAAAAAATGAEEQKVGSAPGTKGGVLAQLLRRSAAGESSALSPYMAHHLSFTAGSASGLQRPSHTPHAWEQQQPLQLLVESLSGGINATAPNPGKNLVGPGSDPRADVKASAPQLLPAEQRQAAQSNGGSSSNAYGAHSKPAVLAFAERIRSGRVGGNPGCGGGGGGRMAPRRLRSGLSAMSGPDEPPKAASAMEPDEEHAGGNGGEGHATAPTGNAAMSGAARAGAAGPGTGGNDTAVSPRVQACSRLDVQAGKQQDGGHGPPQACIGQQGNLRPSGDKSPLPDTGTLPCLPFTIGANGTCDGLDVRSLAANTFSGSGRGAPPLRNLRSTAGGSSEHDAAGYSTGSGQALHSPCSVPLPTRPNPDDDTVTSGGNSCFESGLGRIGAGCYSASTTGVASHLQQQQQHHHHSAGAHTRGGVRRQQHALKRPLSRSSTRSYLMTAMPTSTLNVLGRVHSQRTLEPPESDGEMEGVRRSVSSALRGREGRRSADSEGVECLSTQSLNVSAAEPRMTVPRIFSFMRSASRRMMIQLQQGANTASGGADGKGLQDSSADNAAMTGERRGLRQTTSPGTAQSSACESGGNAVQLESGICSGLPSPNATASDVSPLASTIARSPPTASPAFGSAGDDDGNDGRSAAAAAPDAAYPPLSLPQINRLRGGSDGGGGMARHVSPRNMSPAETARRVGLAWHEVAATSFTDPVTGARVVALVQNDVSEKVETEMQLTELMEVEHRLLEQIFPRHVLEHIAMQNISASQSGGAGQGGGRRQRRKSQFDLLKSQDCSQLAHHHEQITVMFCDVKGFTAMCSSVEPAVVLSFLNMLYTQFDSLLYTHDVYKVETIGDCYMVAGGLVRRGSDGVAALLEAGQVDPDHARKVVHFAKALLQVVREMAMPNGQPLQVRVGIHSGPAMSGVVGTKMPRFCLFGDTINTASRCESTCPPLAIHATTAVRDLAPEEPWVATGGVMAKGKGIMRTFLLGGGSTAAAASAPTSPAHAAGEVTVSDLCATPAPVPAPASAAPAAPAGPASTIASVVASGRLALKRFGSGLRRSSRSLAASVTPDSPQKAPGAVDGPGSPPATTAAASPGYRSGSASAGEGQAAATAAEAEADVAYVPTPVGISVVHSTAVVESGNGRRPLYGGLEGEEMDGPELISSSAMLPGSGPLFEDASRQGVEAGVEAAPGVAVPYHYESETGPRSLG